MNVIFVFLLSAIVLPVNAADRRAKRLLAYYPSWSRSEALPYSAGNIPYKKLTHILHSFLLLDTKADGSLSINPALLEPELISKAHSAGVKVMISIGGASPGQDEAFARVAGNEASRGAFVRNMREFMLARGYDGVDVDWEFPKAPQDTGACVLLMKELRKELPAPKWLISMAVPADIEQNNIGLDISALTPMLDFLNVMAYDYHGPWSKHAGHNAPLFQSSQDPTADGSWSSSIDLYEKRYGVPAEKLNMGTAFYGYEFDGVNELWQPCACSSSTKSQLYGTFIKQRINRPGWKAYFDQVAMAPYLVGRDTALGPTMLISYDDQASTARKVEYALHTRGIGGVFMWRLGADYDGHSQDLLDAMYKALSRAR
jgi:chitinase